jgi:hypothetical protein
MAIITKVDTRRITIALIAFVSLISLVSFVLGVIVISQGVESGILDKLYKLFNLDYEQNLPTWVSSVLLFLVGLHYLLIAYYRHDLEKHHFFQWLFLGLIFLGISFDEFAHIHEQGIRPMRTMFDTGGLLYYPWILPAAILTVVVSLFYFTFIRDLPWEAKLVFIFASVLYVGGALGMEAIGGYYVDTVLAGQPNHPDILYLALTHIEEYCEMLGIILYLHLGMYYLQMMATEEL